MLELRMPNGATIRIKKAAIVAVSTLGNFENELASVIVRADITLASGFTVNVQDAKAKIKEAIDAVRCA